MTDEQNVTEEVAEVTDDELAKPGVMEALVEEIKERAALSNQYIQERDNAKTEVKKKHFHKKLVRNNEESADLLVALERIVAAREANAPNDDEGNTESPSAPEESAD
jgi:hypothetical protein